MTDVKRTDENQEVEQTEIPPEPTTAIVPANQQVDKVLPTIFNSDFAAKAKSLTPTLHSWIETPLSVISFVPDPSEYFKVRAQHQLSIAELERRTWGKGSSFILDFGSHRVGYLSFHLGAEGLNIDAPCRLRLVFGEVPSDVTEELHPCNTWISTSWLPDEVINVDWLPQDVDMPRRYSFRYVKVEILDTSPKYKATFSNIRVRAVSAVDPAVQVDDLGVEDEELREMDRVSRVTLRDCMQTVFEDGPRRDRRLWLGDLRLQALSNYHTFKHYSLVKRCLYLFAALPREDESLPATLFEFPELRPATDYIVDYDALFGPTLYDYCDASQDLDTGRELWSTVLGSMKRPLSHVDPKTGAFDGTLGQGWKFCDWAEKLQTDASMHGLVLYAGKKINALSSILFPDEPPPFEAIVDQMTCAVSSFMSQDAQPCFISGPESQISWSSAAWLSLAEPLPKAQLKEILLATLSHPAAVKPLTPYAFHHVAEALCSVGAEAECLALMRKYWGGMLRAGADTFWECFDEGDWTTSPYGDSGNNSFCHAWSCTPSFLLRGPLGAFLAREGL